MEPIMEERLDVWPDAQSVASWPEMAAGYAGGGRISPRAACFDQRGSNAVRPSAWSVLPDLPPTRRPHLYM